MINRSIVALGYLALFLVARGCASETMPTYATGDTIQLDKASIHVEERTGAFASTIDSHFNDHSALVYMSWFPNFRNEMYATIWPDGTGSYGNIDSGITHTSQKSVVLTADQLAEVNTLLHHLPDSPATVSQAQLLLISYADGKNWTTRGYDRKSPPPQVQRIYAIMHAPLTP